VSDAGDDKVFKCPSHESGDFDESKWSCGATTIPEIPQSTAAGDCLTFAGGFAPKIDEHSASLIEVSTVTASGITSVSKCCLPSFRKAWSPAQHAQVNIETLGIPTIFCAASATVFGMSLSLASPPDLEAIFGSKEGSYGQRNSYS